MLGWRGKDFPKEKQRHLYLVLDDWSWGYSIRKFDLLVGDDDWECSSQPAQFLVDEIPTSVAGCYHDLPPPIFRFEAPRGSPKYFAGAFDSKIMAMQPLDSQFSHNPTDGVLIFDVRKRSLMFGPRQTLDPVDPIYIPVGGRLFALDAGSFQLLYPPPDTNGSESDMDFVWTSLPNPPFQREHVTSYAVHRDGRTIFVSTGASNSVHRNRQTTSVNTGGSPAIFSFDTAESVRDASMWEQHGQWQLPFYGRGYFVAELGSWVGLVRLSKENNRSRWRICSIDVTSDNWDHDHEVKFCELEAGFVGADVLGGMLVSLGGSNFCIAEICWLVTSRCLRLLTFSMMYDQNGDLTTGNSCRCWIYYNLPQEVTARMHENPMAFWM